MLVISRRLHEKVLFPSINVSVKVVGTKPGVVRFGIEAPPTWRSSAEKSSTVSKGKS